MSSPKVQTSVGAGCGQYGGGQGQVMISKCSSRALTLPEATAAISAALPLLQTLLWLFYYVDLIASLTSQMHRDTGKVWVLT